MPFKSEAQRRYLWANEPEIAKDWTDTYGSRIQAAKGGIMYEMQGGSKPARNYLGKQKTVSNVPIKWKSGPDAPETELAYITKAEKDLLLKKNLHGSLKNGPNTGPDGIMSLDSQGDYTRDRSRDAARSQMSRRDSEAAVRQEAERKKVLTGQVDRGQTAKTGPRTRQYSDLPEWMEVKQPDGTYKRKHMASAYKSYGTPSFFGNLFSRGAPGYRGIKGLPAWGNPMKNYQLRGRRDPRTGQLRQDAQGQLGYYTDKENFGELRDALPGIGILGILQALARKFKKPPPDMSKFNELSLTPPEDQKAYIPEGMDVPVARRDPWSTPLTKEYISGYNDMIPGQSTNFIGPYGLTDMNKVAPFWGRGDWDPGQGQGTYRGENLTVNPSLPQFGGADTSIEEYPPPRQQGNSFFNFINRFLPGKM